MGLIHDQAAMIRAVMEGVIYNLKVRKSIFDQKGICQKRLISSGGGAGGKPGVRFRRMFSICLFILRKLRKSLPGSGDLAAVGTGVYGSVSEACEKW